MAYTRRIVLAGLGLAGLRAVIPRLIQKGAASRLPFTAGSNACPSHWHGAATPEASTRVSMEGLKKALAKAGVSC